MVTFHFSLRHRRMNYKRLIAVLAVALSFATSSFGQCAAENTAFRAGEELTYDLFFNWKFIWLNAGSATMKIAQSNWNGKPAYKAHLITRTSDRLDRFFMMRDTMVSIVTEDMSPCYYRKGANEGGRYYVDEVWYSYPGGKTHLRQRYRNRDEPDAAGAFLPCRKHASWREASPASCRRAQSGGHHTRLPWARGLQDEVGRENLSLPSLLVCRVPRRQRERSHHLLYLRRREPHPRPPRPLPALRRSQSLPQQRQRIETLRYNS